MVTSLISTATKVVTVIQKRFRGSRVRKTINMIRLEHCHYLISKAKQHVSNKDEKDYTTPFMSWNKHLNSKSNSHEINYDHDISRNTESLFINNHKNKLNNMKIKAVYVNENDLKPNYHQNERINISNPIIFNNNNNNNNNISMGAVSHRWSLDMLSILNLEDMPQDCILPSYQLQVELMNDLCDNVKDNNNNSNASSEGLDVHHIHNINNDDNITFGNIEYRLQSNSF